MQHQMAVFFVLFFLFFSHISFAETNASVDVNTSQSTLQKTSDKPTFTSTYWQLVKLFDDEIDSDVMHRETYLLFSPLEYTHGEFKGATGCNDILGKYKAASSELSFDTEHIAMTRLACPDVSIESEFLQALKESKSWQIHEGYLALLDVNQTRIAEFKAIDKK